MLWREERVRPQLWESLASRWKNGWSFPNESVLLEKNKAESSALGDTGRKKILMRDAEGAIEEACRETRIIQSQRKKEKKSQENSGLIPIRYCSGLAKS